MGHPKPAGLLTGDSQIDHSALEPRLVQGPPMPLHLLVDPVFLMTLAYLVLAQLILKL